MFSMLPVTLDKHSFSKDSAHRRVLFTFEGKDLLLMRLAREIGGIAKPSSEIRGARPVYTTLQTRTRFATRGIFPKVTFDEILNKQTPKDIFKDKVVILGSVISFVSANYIASPFSKNMKNYSFILLNEAHAHDLNTLIYDQGVIFQPPGLLYVLIFLSAFVSLVASLIAKPVLGFAMWLISFSIVLAGAVASFALTGLVIDIVPILLAGLCCYYVLLPARLVLETRRFAKDKILFARQIGHDIKSPLSALNMLASLNNQLPEKQKSLLKKATQRITSIADSLLEIEKEKLKEIHPIELTAVVESLVSEKKIEFVNRNNLNWTYHCELGQIMTLGHEVELKRTLSNLINNAVEAIEESGQIEVKLGVVDHQAVLEITDSGKGMSASQIQQFGKLKGSSKVKGHGLGVPAAISYLKSSGGSLDCHSQLNLGTTIRLKWPLLASNHPHR